MNERLHTAAHARAQIDLAIDCLTTKDESGYHFAREQILDLPFEILLKKGIENGITYHEASMSRVGKQFEILLNYSNVEDTDFYNPFKYQLLDDSKEAIEIRKEAKKVIANDVMPAFEKLRGKFLFITI